MTGIALLSFALCAGLGWYGAVRAFRVGLGGDRRGLLFSPAGALLFLLAGGASCAAFLWLGHTPGEASLDLIPTVLVIPILGLPYGVYLTCLAVEAGSTFFSLKTSQGELRTYDRGDAALARKDFARAAACYREDLRRWPGDTEAALRLARALECAGQARQAAMELLCALLDLRDPDYAPADGLHRLSTGAPGGVRRDRSERILQLTYALGDLYAGPLGEPERARGLYEETLVRLYGFKAAGPLRERLKRLEDADPSGVPEAREGA